MERDITSKTKYIKSNSISNTGKKERIGEDMDGITGIIGKQDTSIELMNI